MILGFYGYSDNMGAHSIQCSDLLFWLRNDRVSSTPSRFILFLDPILCCEKEKTPEGRRPRCAARAEVAHALEWAGRREGCWASS